MRIAIISFIHCKDNSETILLYFYQNFQSKPSKLEVLLASGETESKALDDIWSSLLSWIYYFNLVAGKIGEGAVQNRSGTIWLCKYVPIAVNRSTQSENSAYLKNVA